MSPTELTTLKGKLEQYEGIVEHMCLDGEGLVTVGVGHMIPSANNAATLSFWHRKTGASATPEEAAMRPTAKAGAIRSAVVRDVDVRDVSMHGCCIG